ncbi:hypothetical protein LOK49_LG12G01175 [Camellia lanceoleosa]|uniref:Uncharacterized protein n=1 Tax=Camellia lanceoleosa TaxID=1840588 RepID=A0ACC0FZD4_9ERIC|nr:hypothetical protein LOK49_LG12G01175 [Camellia lanceoleosa]
MVLSSNSNKSNKSSSTSNQCVKRNGFFGGAVLNLVQMTPLNLRSVLGPQHKCGRVHSLFWRPKSTAIDVGVPIGKNKIVQVFYEPSSFFSLRPKEIAEGDDIVEKSSIPIMSSNSIKIDEYSKRQESGGVHKASYPNNASQRNKERKKKLLKASLVLPKFKRWGIGFREVAPQRQSAWPQGRPLLLVPNTNTKNKSKRRKRIFGGVAVSSLMDALSYSSDSSAAITNVHHMMMTMIMSHVHVPVPVPSSSRSLLLGKNITDPRFFREEHHRSQIRDF